MEGYPQSSSAGPGTEFRWGLPSRLMAPLLCVREGEWSGAVVIPRRHLIVRFARMVRTTAFTVPNQELKLTVDDK